MANFDSNHWQQITLGTGGQSLDGSVLYDAGKGAVFFQNTNTSFSEQQWQIFPFNSTYYVLRSQGSGPIGYMNTALASNEDTPGKTVPDMRNSTQSDDSMFWQITPWGDGTFYMTNAANGTAWHLMNKPNSQMAMTSNITAPQNAQRFVFNQLGEINDKRFSSVLTASATATGTAANSPATTTPTTSVSPTSTAKASSHGLSKNATIAVAVVPSVIGGLAILGAIAYFFFYLKKRKARAHVSPEQTPMYKASGEGTYKAELQAEGRVPSYVEQGKWRPVGTPVEVDAGRDGRVSEMP